MREAGRHEGWRTRDRQKARLALACPPSGLDSGRQAPPLDAFETATRSVCFCLFVTRVSTEFLIPRAIETAPASPVGLPSAHVDRWVSSRMKRLFDSYAAYDDRSRGHGGLGQRARATRAKMPRTRAWPWRRGSASACLLRETSTPPNSPMNAPRQRGRRAIARGRRGGDDGRGLGIDVSRVGQCSIRAQLDDDASGD